MNIIKEFLLYRKLVNTYSLIDLSDRDKVTLEAMNKELIKTIAANSTNTLLKEMLKENLSEEYVRGFKFGIISFLSYFRIYNKE